MLFPAAKANKTSKIDSAVQVPASPKYPSPKILLIDTGKESEIALMAEGYNVVSGSFGTPYKMQMGDSFNPVIINGALPDNYAEQEVVIIDLAPNEIYHNPVGDKQTSPKEKDVWASCNRGVIDPRPRYMLASRKNLDRIYEHGGIFVVFSDSIFRQRQVIGHIGRYDLLDIDDEFPFNNWSFLSSFHPNYFEIHDDIGKEIVIPDNNIVSSLLAQYAKESSFQCTFQAGYTFDDRWITLATNKFNSPIAGLITPKNKEGWILLLPRISDKAGFLCKLLKEVLPSLSPALFPHSEGSRWIQRDNYELPRILDLKSRISKIHEEAAKQIAEIEQLIDRERNDNKFMFQLITETGDDLVASVKKTFEEIGFNQVVDMDDHLEKSSSGKSKREDLQVQDLSPLLLVEIKGISGLPRDAAALQVWKYIAPHMRETGRTDIQGLAIINHQRNLPALDRENEAPFRDDLLVNAQEQKFGLMTSWDLFRLLRSFRKNNWNHENIKNIFYQSGRIEPVPEHYEYIGVIEDYWAKVGAVGVRMQQSSLKTGDRIAFELPVEFEEQLVESLQVEKKAVAEAAVGMLAGIQTHLTKEHAVKNIRVYRIK